MKKLLLFAGVVAAMASCAKNEVVDVNIDNPNIIKFQSPYTSASTKAEMTTDALTAESVGVYAAVNKAETLSSPVIANTELTCVVDASTSTWSSSHSYYWPSDGSSYDFYAYYPFIGDADVTSFGSNGDYKTIADATAFAIAATAEGQVDILASGAITASANNVPLVLNHMLSKVDFQVIVKSQKFEGNLEVIIKSLTLNNINGAHSGLDIVTPAMVAPTAASLASYTYSASAALAMTAADGYLTSAYTGAVAGTTYSLDAADATASAVSASSAMLLLPQTYTPADATVEDLTAATNTCPYVTIEYAIAQNGILIAGAGTNSSPIAAANITSWAASNVALPGFTVSEGTANTWVQGKSYLYTFTFDETELAYDVTKILFDVEAGDWTDGVTTDMTNIE